MNKMPSTPDTQNLPLSLRLLRRVSFPRKLGLLDRLFGKRLSQHGIRWVKTAAGPVWKLDLSDECHRWIVYGDYEGPLQMRWVRHWLRNGDVIIDSGANIGQMLLYFASTAQTRILAFEPLPSARLWLLECLALQSGWNVAVLDCGLGEGSHTVTLQVCGSLSTTRLDWYSTRALDTIEIQVESLDSKLEALGVERVRLWKLDMEGGEPSAIRGARNSLQSRRIEAVLVESNPGSFAELSACFEAVGFALFEISRRGELRIATGCEWGNLLALPAEHRHSIHAAA